MPGYCPGEVLSAPSPVPLQGLWLQGMERVELLPDGGQIRVLEHDHELPMGAQAALHHQPVGVESVEQEQNRQASIFAVPVRVTQPRGLHSVAAMPCYDGASLAMRQGCRANSRSPGDPGH